MYFAKLSGLIVVLLLAALAIPQAERSFACAPAPPRGVEVKIADESAIIIWDATTKTQHFIRRASFNTEARDFGFLVPTPTQPTLAEADDKTFVELARVTAPRIETQPRPTATTGPGCGCGTQSPRPMVAAPPPVQVLEEKRVAGYDAVVLQADDANALGQWLKDHGYEFSQVLVKWVEPYVASGWKVSAFKIAKDTAEARNVATSAVRMTFETERPFFPYREPPEQLPAGQKQASSRLLRVFFLGESRVKGTQGGRDSLWPGQTAWAGQMPAADREKLLQLLKLPATALPASCWLTEFEDPSSPRPGSADVYFSPSQDQSPVERPSQIHYVLTGGMPDAITFAFAVCLVTPCLVRAWRRRWRQE